MFENPISQLDKALQYLSSDKDYPETFEELKAGLLFNDKDLNLILNKLKKDGFIDVKNLLEGITLNGASYLINFDGLIFNDFGGYTQSYINDNIKLKAIEDQNQRMERNEERLVLWTKILA